MILNLIHLAATVLIFMRAAVVFNRSRIGRTPLSYLLPIGLFGVAAVGVGLEQMCSGSTVTVWRLVLAISAAMAVWACGRSRPRHRINMREWR
jgi:hypothetical protein